jgi:hypothetical protein
MATKQKDNSIRRLLIVHILIKALLDPRDLKQFRMDLEDLVIQEIIDEAQSKKIRETFRDLIGDLEEITPVLAEENIRINVLIASLKADEVREISRIAGKPFNYAVFAEVRECLSKRDEKFSLADCKSIINYFKQNNNLH